jgi:hypothetical protein
MTSALDILPTEKIGVVVLSNLDHTGMPGAVARWVLERHLHIPLETVAQSGRAGGGGGGGRGAGQASASPASLPALPLTAYTGTFVDSLLGELTITVQEDKLVGVRGLLHGTMESAGRDNFTWSTGLIVLPTLPLEFRIGPDGRARSVIVTLQGDARELVRKAASARAAP